MNAYARPNNKAVRKGLAHLDAGRVDSAERLFRSVLKSEPNNPEANYALGTLVVIQGKPQSAPSYLNAALQADPQQGQHWFSFVEALLMAGAAGDARTILERAVARGFSTPEIAALKLCIDCAELYRIALDHHAAGRLDEAEKFYTAVLKADRGHVESLYMLGQLAARTERVQVGLQLIREAIRLEGDVPAFHCGLGNVLAECGEVNEAIQAFQHALALQPAFSEAQTGLGKCIVRETTSRLRWRNLTPSSPAA